MNWTRLHPMTIGGTRYLMLFGVHNICWGVNIFIIWCVGKLHSLSRFVRPGKSLFRRLDHVVHEYGHFPNSSRIRIKGVSHLWPLRKVVLRLCSPLSGFLGYKKNWGCQKVTLRVLCMHFNPSRVHIRLTPRSWTASTLGGLGFDRLDFCIIIRIVMKGWWP